MRYNVTDWDGGEESVELPNTTGDFNLDACKAAEHFYSYRDGWDASWPITLTLTNAKGEQRRFGIERYMEPVFTARRLS